MLLFRLLLLLVVVMVAGKMISNVFVLLKKTAKNLHLLENVEEIVTMKPGLKILKIRNGEFSKVKKDLKIQILPLGQMEMIPKRVAEMSVNPKDDEGNDSFGYFKAFASLIFAVQHC